MEKGSTRLVGVLILTQQILQPNQPAKGHRSGLGRTKHSLGETDSNRRDQFGAEPLSERASTGGAEVEVPSMRWAVVGGLVILRLQVAASMGEKKNEGRGGSFFGFLFCSIFWGFPPPPPPPTPSKKTRKRETAGWSFEPLGFGILIHRNKGATWQRHSGKRQPKTNGGYINQTGHCCSQ